MNPMLLRFLALYAVLATLLCFIAAIALFNIPALVGACLLGALAAGYWKAVRSQIEHEEGPQA